MKKVFEWLNAGRYNWHYSEERTQWVNDPVSEFVFMLAALVVVGIGGLLAIIFLIR